MPRCLNVQIGPSSVLPFTPYGNLAQRSLSSSCFCSCVIIQSVFNKIIPNIDSTESISVLDNATFSVVVNWVLVATPKTNKATNPIIEIIKIIQPNFRLLIVQSPFIGSSTSSQYFTFLPFQPPMPYVMAYSFSPSTVT